MQALALSLALPCSGIPAQEIHQGIRMVTTRDGSRFVLIPTGGPPVVHWVSLIPVGVEEDPPGLEGLSLALVRASLAGTHALGSEDPLKEATVVARARRLERQLAIDDDKDPALEALLAQAQAEIQRLARPLAWEKALRAAPSSGSRLQVVTGGVLLQVTTTTRGLLRVAELLKDRRDHALLRGVHTHFEQVRAERRNVFAQDPRTPLRRRLLAKVYQDHPFGRFHAITETTDLTFEVALDAYRRISDPKRSRQVIVGGFDVDTVEAVLKHVFEHAPEQTRTVDLPRLQQGQRPLGQTTVKTRDTLALGCPIPKTASVRDLVVFALWLAADSDSYLVEALRARGHPRLRVRATAPFPGAGGLLLVEITKPDARLTADSKLVKDLQEVLTAAMEQAPAEAQLARAHQRFLATRARMLASPGSMALHVARIWALTGEPPLAELKAVEAQSDISGTTIQKMCQQMFSHDNRMLVLPGGGA